MTQQSGLRLDNRATGLLAGLLALVAIGILAAIYFDNGTADEVATVNPDGTEVSQPADDGGDNPDAAPTDAATATDEPAVIPDAQPTSVFVPAGGAAAAPADTDPGTADAGTADAGTADAGTADASTSSGSSGSGGALVTDFEDDDFVPTEDDRPEVTPLPEPTPRTNDPFAFAGEASFWEDQYLDDGATINTNVLDFIINNDGTGSFRGTLDVSWPDGSSLLLSIDRDFEWDTEYTRVRSTLIGEVIVDGETSTAGTLAIAVVKDGFGSICFGSFECPSFQYEPPFWSLSPDA